MSSRVQQLATNLDTTNASKTWNSTREYQKGERGIPKVSIGLPVFNGEKYLKEALDSIIAQTYVNFELIISDNASTDQTQAICLEYVENDQRIRYYRNNKNIGAVPNHNHVFNLARGEYFKWVGYDDRMARDFLHKCVEILDDNPDVILCMSKTSLIDDKGESLGDYDEYLDDVDSSKPEARFENFVLKNHSGNFCYGLMRKRIVAKTSLLGSYPASDEVFLAEMALCGKYHAIPERLFYRRYHQEQSTKGALKNFKQRIVWNDTSLQGKIVLARWMRLSGYLKAIKNTSLNVFERIRCYSVLFRWIFFPATIRSLIKDVLVATQQIVLRTSSNLKKKIHI